MFTNYLYMVSLLLVPLRMIDDPEAAEIYVKYQTFIIPRFFMGAIRNADDYYDAVDQFTTMILDED